VTLAGSQLAFAPDRVSSVDDPLVNPAEAGVCRGAVAVATDAGA
jgi:hypothetical protein